MTRALVLLATVAPLLAATPAAALSPQVGEHEVRLAEGTVRALCTPGLRRVVLLRGESGGADAWRPVLERLDGAIGACAYDRVEPAPGRTGWFALMDEMHRVHEALGLRSGYALVGQGLGGMYARLYAAGRPADVGALVLLDPAHEDWPEEARHAMPAAAWGEWMRRRSRTNADGVTEIELAKRARGARLPQIPVTVVTASRRPEGAGWDARFMSRAARRVHASILEGIAHGRHIPASRSGHDVRADEPELVAREIGRAARTTNGGN